MGRARRHLVEPKRITLLVSDEQAKIIDDGVAAAGMKDRSAWCVAHLVRSAGAALAVDAEDSPIMIDGDLAKRFRAEAKRQGITPAAAVQQLAAFGSAA